MHYINRKMLLGAFFTACIVTGTAYAGDTFVFDPDGGGSDSPILVSSFDWLPGNALAEDAVPIGLIDSPTAFTQYFHASLGSFIDSNSSVITDTGLNKDYEITIVSGAGEVGFFDPIYNTAIFSFDPNNSTNFVRIYADTAQDSDPLSGTGFNNGTLILTGETVNISGPYTVQTTVTALDDFVNNDYPNTQTVTGFGGSSQTITVLTYNATYFPEGVPQSLEFNTNLRTPFQQVDPSQSFTSQSDSLIVSDLGDINGSTGPDFQFQADANNSFSLAEIVEGQCRMTGGGVSEDGEIILDEDGVIALLAEANDGKNRYTFGGQIGAPSASQPTPYGEWTHHQFKGPAGRFVFRAGTHSAPPETKVLTISCNDPGYCNPARPAPFKQLDWEGVGSFKNVSGPLKSLVIPDNQATFTLHYVKVHYEDIGEPGPGGKQPHSPACTHTIGDVIDESEDCTNCPDVYQIEIHASESPSSQVIYSVGGFIDNGNIQLHPAIN